MAGKTSSGGNSTRFIETSRGILSYSQLAPLLGERVLRVEQQVSSGAFARHRLGGDLIRDLHLRIASDLVPDWAGRWRTSEVIVGEHSPPPPYQVALRMRDYGDDLEARFATSVEPASENLLESLAFAEGRLLSIHPFLDFNGRVTRLFLQEIIQRQGLPPVQFVPAGPEAEAGYISALRAGDSGNWKPLVDVWKRRFEPGLGK
jgi:CRISPR-associated endonuclease/helicase Cas3